MRTTVDIDDDLLVEAKARRGEGAAERAVPD
jgi:hypothetical protein